MMIDLRQVEWGAEPLGEVLLMEERSGGKVKVREICLAYLYLFNQDK